MAIRCPHCKREYDVTLFEFEKSIECACGNTIAMGHHEIFKELLTSRRDEENKIKEIKNMADEIALLILTTDCLDESRPVIDIEVEKEKLRKRINEIFPDKAHMYGLIYEPRFKRLEEQFRGEGKGKKQEGRGKRKVGKRKREKAGK